MLIATLLPLLVVAPDLQAARPSGHVMGDGMNLTIPPQDGGGVCAARDTLFGIDVSYYQGTIDWNAVAADGVQFAFVRVSDGLDYPDSEFQTNLAGSRSAGIATGVYQYFRPAQDPIEQADLFLDAMGPWLDGDLPPVIDVESDGGLSPAQVAASVRTWVDYVEAATGVAPIIYTGHYFWQASVVTSEFGDHPLWVAWYGVDCPGAVPDGWDMWSFHQYCDCGTIAGIAGPVDVNTFAGSAEDLAALSGSQAAVCGDGICQGAEASSCPEDCPPCGVIGPEGGTIDNGDACYELRGEAQYWNTEEGVGFGGSLAWTHAIDGDTINNHAVISLHVAEAGEYRVESHVPAPYGQSKQAPYTVTHAGGEDTVVVDQSAAGGWVDLGTYNFNEEMSSSVTLVDATGEPFADSVQIVFDAVRLTRVDGGVGATGSGDGGTTGNDTTATTGQETAGGSGSESTEGGGSSTTEGPGASGASSGPLVPAGDPGEDTSGCQVGGSGSGSAFLLLPLLWRRRRRRAAAPR